MKKTKNPDGFKIVRNKDANPSQQYHAVQFRNGKQVLPPEGHGSPADVKQGIVDMLENLFLTGLGRDTMMRLCKPSILKRIEDTR